MECFAVNGIGGTSMADIIRTSGLSSGAIYSHFDSKAELLRYVMSTMLEGRFTAVAAEPDGPASIVTPDALLTRLLAGPSADRAQTSVLVQVWGEMARDRDLARIAEENLEHLRELLTTTLEPWSEQQDDAERAGDLAAHTTDWLIAVTFGYATVTALQSGEATGAFQDNLLRAARSMGTAGHRAG